MEGVSSAELRGVSRQINSALQGSTVWSRKGSLSWVEVTRSICEQMKSDFGYFEEPNCSADWGRTENRIKRQIIYVLVFATLLSCLSKLVDYSHANHEDDHRETHANQEATSLCVQVKDEEIAGDRSAEEGAEEEDTEEEEEEGRGR